MLKFFFNENVTCMCKFANIPIEYILGTDVQKILRGLNIFSNIPTCSWATLVVNPSRTVGSLRPFLFVAKTRSRRSLPGLSPVIMKTGLGLETLASTMLLITSIT